MRFCFSSVFTTLLLLFLWAPFACLISGAVQQAFSQQPDLLIEALPLRALSRSLFYNSLVLAFLSGILSCVLGIFPALALARGPKNWRPVLTLFCALPLALPPTLMATAWLELSRTPPARSLAALAANQPLPIDGIFIAAPLLALCFFPIATFALALAFGSFSPDCEEAAHLFGDKWQALWYFYRPQLTPALFGAMGATGALSLWEMGACDLLDARTYSVEIYRAFNAGGEESIAALRSLPMLLIGALLLFPALRALRFYNGQNSARRNLFISKAGIIGCVFALPVLGVAVGAPVWVFARQMKSATTFFDVWRDNSEELWNTILLSWLAAPCIAYIAFMAVTSWRLWPARHQKTALVLGVLPLLFPPITLGIALISFYNREAFALVYGGLAPTGHALLDWLTANFARYGMMLLGYAARFLPLALWILWEASRRVDDALLEAAQNMGDSSGRAARKILWPLLQPALYGIMILLWALCAGELTVSILVNQPGGQTLPKPIFNLMHIGESERVAALSLTLFGLVALAFSLGAALNCLSRNRR
jgi:iron(III) transport system permease protein